MESHVRSVVNSPYFFGGEFPILRKRFVIQGSDFFTIYVRPTNAPLAAIEGVNVSHDDGRLSDEIRFVKFSGIVWTHDDKGFFYQVSPSLTREATLLIFLFYKAFRGKGIPWVS